MKPTRDKRRINTVSLTRGPNRNPTWKNYSLWLGYFINLVERYDGKGSFDLDKQRGKERHLERALKRS